MSKAVFRELIVLHIFVAGAEATAPNAVLGRRCIIMVPNDGICCKELALQKMIHTIHASCSAANALQATINRRAAQQMRCGDN